MDGRSSGHVDLRLLAAALTAQTAGRLLPNHNLPSPTPVHDENPKEVVVCLDQVCFRPHRHQQPSITLASPLSSLPRCHLRGEDRILCVTEENVHKCNTKR